MLYTKICTTFTNYNIFIFQIKSNFLFQLKLGETDIQQRK